MLYFHLDVWLQPCCNASMLFKNFPDLLLIMWHKNRSTLIKTQLYGNWSSNKVKCKARWTRPHPPYQHVFLRFSDGVTLFSLCIVTLFTVSRFKPTTLQSLLKLSMPLCLILKAFCKYTLLSFNHSCVFSTICFFSFLSVPSTQFWGQNIIVWVIGAFRHSLTLKPWNMSLLNHPESSKWKNYFTLSCLAPR